MKLRTKRKLKFYLSLAGIILLTLAVGIFFEYVAFLAWQMHLQVIQIKYEIFAAMASILFIMCILDIFLFLRLIIKRHY
ncbi:MAG: hypothetical protein OEZ35_01405 [Candidatus Bathyarchaeota archaeon]|nr:hypothetical protein [Candidatus Bathyarchaeota archaeon]